MFISRKSFRFAQVTQGIVTENLVFNLDAENPASYPGSGTTWTDLVQNFNTTLTNGPVFTSGNPSYFTFDGTNDFIEIGYDASLVPPNITSSVWIYPISGSGIIVRSRTFGFGTGLDAGPILQTFVHTSSTSGGHLIPSSTLSYNNWYNVTQTLKGNQHSMYLNGQLIGRKTTSDDSVYYAGAQYLGLARDGNANSNYFNGRISCFQFYNRGLTALEVQQNFNALRARFEI